MPFSWTSGRVLLANWSRCGCLSNEREHQRTQTVQNAQIPTLFSAAVSDQFPFFFCRETAMTHGSDAGNCGLLAWLQNHSCHCWHTYWPQILSNHYTAPKLPFTIHVSAKVMLLTDAGFGRQPLCALPLRAKHGRQQLVGGLQFTSADIVSGESLWSNHKTERQKENSSCIHHH